MTTSFLNSLCTSISYTAFSRSTAVSRFNDLYEWHYHKVCELLGGGVGCHVQTYRELVEALRTALADTVHLYVLNVELDPNDHSIAMKRVAQRLAKRVSSEKE